MKNLEYKDFKYFIDELAVIPELDLIEIAMEDYDYEPYSWSPLEIQLVAKSGPMYCNIFLMFRALHVVDSGDRDSPPSHDVSIEEFMFEQIDFCSDDVNDFLDLKGNKRVKNMIIKALGL